MALRRRLRWASTVLLLVSTIILLLALQKAQVREWELEARVEQLEQENGHFKGLRKPSSTDWVGMENQLSKKTTALRPRRPIEVVETFDIVINAFKRDAELLYAVGHYASCAHVGLSQIHVIWNDHQRKLPEGIQNFTYKVAVFVPPGNKISYRFWPLNFTTDAVFHVDDDMIYSCMALDDMFQIWRTDPNGMVGAMPRKLQLGDLDWWLWPLTTGEYNMIFITKGAFVHRRFFDEFWKEVWKPMRRVVDEYMCGEDALFGWMFLVVSGSVHHLYAIAGSVNNPNVDIPNTQHFIAKEYAVHVSPGTYTALNLRTWNVRKNASAKIAAEIRRAFPTHVEHGFFHNLNHKWWRSIVNWALTCRGQGVACYNRAWDECSVNCDTVVRGQSACFTADSACWAGNMHNAPIGSRDAALLICHGPQRDWCYPKWLDETTTTKA